MARHCAQVLTLELDSRSLKPRCSLLCSSWVSSPVSSPSVLQLQRHSPFVQVLRLQRLETSSHLQHRQM
eukprot:462562-Hanusia_phi.AAC.5